MVIDISTEEDFAEVLESLQAKNLHLISKPLPLFIGGVQISLFHRSSSLLGLFHPSFLCSDDTPIESKECNIYLNEKKFIIEPQLCNREAYPVREGESIMASDIYISLSDYKKKECAAMVLENLPADDLLTIVRWLIPPFLIDFQILPIHASGVVHKEKGILFIGHSGAGKSTLARLSSPRRVLSDECILIKKDGDAFTAYGTPFGRENKGENIHAPLYAIMDLKKDSRNYLKPLPFHIGLNLIMKHLWTSTIPKANLELLLNLAVDIARVTPAYELHFKKESTFWNVIDEQIFSHL